MAQVPGVEEAIVDTTARAHFKTAENKKPDPKVIEKALAAVDGVRLRPRKFKKLKMKNPVAIYEVKLDGLG